MDSIIQTFHIDWKLMVAQIVNFVIVVFVLWFFAFKPLSQKMAERTKKIEKGLQDAIKISDNLKTSEKQKELLITAARKDAMKIIEEAKIFAEKEREKSVIAARTEVEKVIAQGKSQIANEKTEMLREVKADIAQLVVHATSKILEKISDREIDKNLAEETLREMRHK